MLAVVAGGRGLRESTSGWFARHAGRMALGRSLEIVLAVYAGDAITRS